MGVWHFWDVTRGMDVDEFSQLVREVAKFEVLARRETLAQVLELLDKAAEKGLGVGDVRGVVAEWLDSVAEEYDFLVQMDPLFSGFRDKVEKMAGKAGMDRKESGTTQDDLALIEEFLGEEAGGQ